MMNFRRRALRMEHGQVVVLFALLIPVLFGLGAVVITLGNWFTHAKHLQTKVDAAALAGGQAWGFPCGLDSDTRADGTGIVDVAREYVGPHTTATGLLLTNGYNPQIGKVPGDDIHVVLNGSPYWDDDAGTNPPDFTSPAGSVCEAKILDVKATEANSFPLFGLLPFFPDLKRKARVQIEEAAGATGLLPIAVRIPRPLSAAAVFYNEGTEKILDVKYFREVCIPGVLQCVVGAPAGLGQWTTDPAPGSSGELANFQVAATTGVAIATSFRAACNVPGATAPCLDDAWAPGDTATDFCRQNATIRCFDATGGGTSQVVESGVQFIRGYGTAAAAPGPPPLRTAYLNNPSTGCYPYFNSVPSQCTNQLNVEVDVGALIGSYPNPPGPPPGPLTPGPLRASDVQVRYRVERAGGSNPDDCPTYGNQCHLFPASPNATGTVTFATDGSGSAPHVPLEFDSQGNAISLEVRVRNTTNLPGGDCADFNDNCRWFYTANTISPSVPPPDALVLAGPIQRSFMGELDRTGPLKWLRVTRDIDCDKFTIDRIVGWDPIALEDAASQPAGQNRCFIMEMGLQGGMARDQDEPPIALLLGSGASQRALVDCDPNVPFGQVDDEITKGCQWPPYTGNKFDNFPNDCPWGDDTPGKFFDIPKPAPFDDWPAFDCVLTRTTGSASQIEQGFDKRFFTNSPYSCPTDDGSPYQRGRNYWHRANNSNDTHGFKWDGDGNPLLDRGTYFNPEDPRAVTLFLTPYGSFTGSGIQVQELVGLGSFYVTGYGKFTGSGLQILDPCDDGAGGGSPSVYTYAGNDPPPDISGSSGQRVVWGHFIKDAPGGATGGTGDICEPQLTFNPCVPVLIE